MSCIVCKGEGSYADNIGASSKMGYRKCHLCGGSGDMFKVSSNKDSITVSFHSPLNPIFRGEASATCMADSFGFWMINRVLIQPESQRGRGVGTMMLQRLIKELKSQNALTVHVTPGGYEASDKQFEFYKKVGFQETHIPDLLELSLVEEPIKS